MKQAHLSTWSWEEDSWELVTLFTNIRCVPDSGTENQGAGLARNYLCPLGIPWESPRRLLPQEVCSLCGRISNDQGWRDRESQPVCALHDSISS